MREKDIKKLIKHEIESHIPAQPPKIDFEFAQKDVQIKKRWYAVFSPQLALSSVFVLAIVVLAIMFGSNGTTPIVKAYEFKSDEEIISFSALSTTAMLNTIQIDQLSQQNHTMLATTSYQDMLINTVEPYLDLAEKFLKEDALMVEVADSELLEYTSKITFHTIDLIGKPSTYVMHYNITLLSEDEEESEYEIDGILHFGIYTYDVIGRKEVEDDEEEFSFIASIDSNNYVESSYEFDIEDQEKKFKFKRYEQGVLISESDIKIEVEDNKSKFVIEFREGQNQGEFEFEYRTINNEEVIKIEFDSFIDFRVLRGEMTVKVIIDDITGLSSYRIVLRSDDDDDEKIVDRERKEDDDDETEPSEPSEPEEPTESEDPTEPEEPSEPSEPDDDEDDFIEDNEDSELYDHTKYIIL
jgi:hypothetical protein